MVSECAGGGAEMVTRNSLEEERINEYTTFREKERFGK